MRADYHAIETGIKAVLEADLNLTGVKVLIEADFVPPDNESIVIYLDRREAPDSEQRLTAGRRTNFIVRLSLWCVGADYESIERASERRDDLIGYAETALMENRTLNDTVGSFYLDGGEFVSVKEDETGGFLSAGEIIVMARIISQV